MLIIYDSKTGNVERFIRQLGVQAVKIDDVTVVEEPFVLVTYTTGRGEVPPKVSRFLEKNSAYLAGVAASGNRNWGANFGKSADIISSRYHVPIVSKFELFGTKNDVSLFKKGVDALETYRVKQ